MHQQYHPIIETDPQYGALGRHYHLFVEAINVVVGAIALGMVLNANASTVPEWPTLVSTALATLSLQFLMALIMFTATLAPSMGCFRGYATSQTATDWRVYHFFIFTNNLLCVLGIAYCVQQARIAMLLALSAIRALVYIPLITANEDLFSVPSTKNASGEVVQEDEASIRRQFHLYLAASGIDTLCLLVMLLAAKLYEEHPWPTAAIPLFVIVSRVLHALYLKRRPDPAVLSPPIVFSVEAFIANTGLWIALVLWPLHY